MIRITKSASERRNEILDTAESLFSEKGYEKTSTTDITKKMGVAQGTLYYYFKSKESLANALIDRQLNGIKQEFTEVIYNETLTAYEKIAWIFVYELDDPTGHVDIFKYLQHDSNATLRQILHVQTICQFTPLLTDLNIQGNNEGLFHIENPTLVAEFFLSTIHHWVDSSLFKWNKDERIARIKAIQSTFEHLFGVPHGKFDLSLLRQTVNVKFNY
ncbi:TetR/AcrR family transcriptional regulator [Lysinibacillus fusiformis]|uniref:TetR/AcrR family transcriptional regulator n=1 Tax=Lysinibacillus fusiformis TaxID=28031 RepID=UPI000468C968|nr:TetR/AcrR family transcriptional regulator [Lysinibacillus fusiformis]